MMVIMGFAENLVDGQLCIKTMADREYEEWDDAADLGGDFGYWLFRYHELGKTFEPLAKFISQEAIETFVTGTQQMIVYWPEGE